ncbi:MAG: phosphoglycerate kinase [Acidobacteriota bacterium]
MRRLLTLEDLDLSTLRGRRVFVRVDYNVPFKDGRVLDVQRLEESLPTLRELIAAGGRILLASHCGRPKGEPNPRYSLRPVAGTLAELLGSAVSFAEDSVGGAAERAAAALFDGGVCLLENLRYHAGEEKNDPAFVDALMALIGPRGVYVDDAFGSAHRAHASVVGVAARSASKAAGRLLVREVVALSRLLDSPEKPFAALLGGAKIEDKIDTLENLLPRLDCLMVGGGMANTFLAARGLDLKDSLFERDRLDLAREILVRAAAQGTEVLLPNDLVVTDDLGAPRRIEVVAVDAIPGGMKAVDIGPATRERFAAAIARARTLFWNGPLGVFEKPPFDAGTRAAADAVGQCAGWTVAGGGETIAAARQAGVLGQLGHVSTGGGAALEFLAGKTLPGVAILERE